MMTIFTWSIFSLTLVNSINCKCPHIILRIKKNVNVLFFFFWYGILQCFILLLFWISQYPLTKQHFKKKKMSTIVLQKWSEKVKSKLNSDIHTVRQQRMTETNNSNCREITIEITLYWYNTTCTIQVIYNGKRKRRWTYTPFIRLMAFWLE